MIKMYKKNSLNVWSIIFDILFNMISKKLYMDDQVNLGCTSPVSVHLEQLLTI